MSSLNMITCFQEINRIIPYNNQNWIFCMKHITLIDVREKTNIVLDIQDCEK